MPPAPGRPLPEGAAADLDRLAQIAETGKSERHRLRAAQFLEGWRQRAADALAGALAVKEQVMDAKGLSNGGTQVAVFDFTGMSMEKLKALAEGRPLLPEKTAEGEPPRAE